MLIEVRRGVAQLGSALALGARGPGFKSRHPDHGFFAAEEAVFVLGASRKTAAGDGGKKTCLENPK